VETSYDNTNQFKILISILFYAQNESLIACNLKYLFVFLSANH